MAHRADAVVERAVGEGSDEAMRGSLMTRVDGRGGVGPAAERAR